MAEYIEREALLENLKRQYGEDLGWQCTVNMSDVGMMIEDASAADLVEVRHGEWMEKTEPLGWSDVNCIECSACGESWITDEELCVDDYKDGWKYCPHCGAKMDGKGECE